jgi:hypothetical protein
MHYRNLRARIKRLKRQIAPRPAWCPSRFVVDKAIVASINSAIRGMEAIENRNGSAENLRSPDLEEYEAFRQALDKAMDLIEVPRDYHPGWDENRFKQLSKKVTRRGALTFAESMEYAQRRARLMACYDNPECAKRSDVFSRSMKSVADSEAEKDQGAYAPWDESSYEEAHRETIANCKDRLLKLLRRHPDGLTVRDMYPALNSVSAYIEESLKALKESGEVEQIAGPTRANPKWRIKPSAP